MPTERAVRCGCRWLRLSAAALLVACGDAGPDYAWHAEGDWSDATPFGTLSVHLQEGRRSDSPTNADLSGSGTLLQGGVAVAFTASGLRSTNLVTLELRGESGSTFMLMDALLDDGNRTMTGSLDAGGVRSNLSLRRR